MVEDELANGKSPAEAVHAALKPLRGAFALVYLFEGDDNLLIGAPGAPLAVGDGEMYLGSDALALAPFTDRVAAPIQMVGYHTAVIMGKTPTSRAIWPNR